MDKKDMFNMEKCKNLRMVKSDVLAVQNEIWFYKTWFSQFKSKFFAIGDL